MTKYSMGVFFPDKYIDNTSIIGLQRSHSLRGFKIFLEFLESVITKDTFVQSAAFQSWILISCDREN